MASRRFTVDPAKKKKFLNFILQMPKLHVPDAMKLAMFSNEDIADLRLRRFLQRPPRGHSESNEGAPWCISSAQTTTT
jgi:hypothetical protein